MQPYLQLLGCMSVLVQAHRAWTGQLQCGRPVAGNRNEVSNKQPQPLENNCPKPFQSAIRLPFCVDAGHVGAGKGFCVGV